MISIRSLYSARIWHHVFLATASLCFTVVSSAGEITRYPLPNKSTFPIAQAVEVSAGTTIIYHSGTIPGPAKPDTEKYSAEFWGNTEAQALSCFSRMQTSFDKLGVSYKDVIKMTVFLVGVPEQQGRMDFSGFMNAYTQYFGTSEQPNLPARSAVQVAGLAAPGMLVEIEVILARPKK